MPRSAVRRKNAPLYPVFPKMRALFQYICALKKPRQPLILNLYNVICTACPPAVGGTVQKKEEDVL